MKTNFTSSVETYPAQAVSLKIFLAFLCFLLASGLSQAQVSGTVFRDFNANGIRNVTTSLNEIGVPGVMVKAYNASGAQVGSTQTTSATGAYAFTGLTLPVRIEFSGLPTGNFSGPQGSGNGTSVQFVSAASTAVNYGINMPVEYCQPAPNMFVPCFVNGDPLSGTSVGNRDAIVLVPYTASGTSPAPVEIAKASEVGSVWGMAYHRASKRLLSAAFLKRHTGLGTGGLGGIYLTNTVAKTTSLYFDLEAAPFNLNLGQSVIGTRSLPNSATTSSNDPTAFDAVGKVGLGGVALSTDETTVYTIDLFNKKLIRINVGSPLKASIAASDVSSITLPDPGCTNGQARPFAVTFYEGKVYVGIICTAESSGGTTANLRAYVYVFDPVAGTFATGAVAEFPLNYPKGKVHTSETPSGWQPWISQFSQLYLGNAGGPPLPRAMQPQPMLTDIDFIENGDMVLGLSDRAGHQLGYNNRGTSGTALYNGYVGGDILRLAKSGATWTLESNGTVSGLTGKSGNGQGPGGGEFYYEEIYPQTGTVIHQETYMGSSAHLAGYADIAATVMDPVSVFTGGFSWFSNTNGTSLRQYEVYDSNSDGSSFGKANGLGAIAIGCNLAPIEIGNRVWNDLNKNGIQDPNEPPLVGVTVALCDSTGAPITGATAVTDALGQYIFSSGPGTNTTTIKYNLPIAPLTNYQLKITALGTNASVAGIALTNVSPTPGETGSTNTGATLNNNDAKLVAAKPTIAFRTGGVGENNHTYDFGLFCTPPGITAAVYAAATCPTNGSTTPNNNASLRVTTNGSKAAISITGPPTTTFAAATAVPTTGANAGSITFTNQNGAADSLYVRVFSSQDCFKDTIIVVTPVVCCPTVTISTPANFASYCAGASIPTLTATTNAQSPDSIRFVYFDNKQTVAAQIYAGTNVLGKVKITGTANANNTATLTNVALPTNATAVNDTIWIYAVYLANNGNTACRVFGEKPVILKPQPNAGPDATICAPATTAQLSAVTSGGTFAAQAGNPANATVTNAGAVSNLTANGIYRFIYTVAGCTDTATVTRAPKPNAGPDQVLACADPNAGTLQTSTTLAGFSPAGGAFTATTGNPAATTVTPGGAVSGMTVAGTYNFVYTLNGCADTVAVTVQPCPTCTKPNAGADQSICAPATTATLTGFSPAGGVFTVQAGNPAAATVSGTGAVSGLTANGTYRFIYSVTQGGLTCRDTVAIIRNAKPVVGDATICAPTSTVSVTVGPAGGVFAPQAGNPANATITAAGVVSGLTANGTYRFVYTLNGCADTSVVIRNAKPDAGVDKTLPCADPVAGTLQTSTTLTGFSPAGGVFTAAAGNPAAATVTPGGAVSGMSIAGNYKFIYTLNGCADTVAVMVQACAGCTTPDAGDDQTLVCSGAGVAPTTATLTGFAPTGGTFTVAAGNPANATVTNTGAVSGLSAAGTYRFVYSVTQGGQTCRDTVTVIVPTCAAPVGSIGDYVFKDANKNGKQDAGETGVNGVKVILYSADAAGTPGAKLDSATTANGGKYLFSNLPAGDYVVQFVKATIPPDCDGFTAQDTTGVAGINDANDSDADKVTGFTGKVTLAPKVLGPGSTPADSLATNNLTVDAGLLPKVVPFGSLGDYVFKDSNDNGRQDDGEPGVADVKLKLLDDAGKYVATGMLSGSQEVPPVVTPATGYVKTALDTTSNQLIVSIQYTGLSGPPTMAHIHKGQPGVNGPIRVAFTGLPTTTSATYTTTVTLPDSLEADYLANGLYVNIHTAANPGGELRAQLNACAITDTQGKYTFIALDSASYRVLVDKASLPDSCKISTKPNQAGVADSLDSDFDPNTGISDPVTVNPNAAATKDITTVDLGLVTPLTPLGSIGDYVFKDKNDNGLQDAGDVPVSGVRLNLYAAAGGTKTGPILASDTTDAAGKYRFDSLAAGDYIVEIDRTTLPDSCLISGKKDVNANGNDATDSDFDPTSGLSQVVTLNPVTNPTTPSEILATNNLTVDAGLVTKPIAPTRVDLALDKSIDKKMAMLGDTVGYTIRVFNQGTVLATGVEVTDSLAAGLQFVSSSGAYNQVTKIWTVGNVPAGDTVTLVIRAKVVASGVVFNTAQISKVNEQDVDSTPGNGAEGEDDIDRECFTVPILLCRGQGFGAQLSVPAQYTGVVWFRAIQGGQPVQVATGNTYTAVDTELGSYEYTFTSTSGSCPAEGCCPVIVVVEDCCPAQVCVPYTVTKRRK